MVVNVLFNRRGNGRSVVVELGRKTFRGELLEDRLELFDEVFKGEEGEKVLDFRSGILEFLDFTKDFFNKVGNEFNWNISYRSGNSWSRWLLLLLLHGRRATFTANQVNSFPTVHSIDGIFVDT